MLSWFTRSHNHQHAPVQSTQWTVSENPGALLSRSGTNSGVTYASRDKKGNREFFCTLPEGSQHAAQAQQIASSIFSGQSSSTKALKDSQSQRRLIEGSGQLASASSVQASPGSARVRYEDSRVNGSFSTNKNARFANPNSMPTADSSLGSEVEVMREPEASRGFRHRGPTHTTYALRSKNREMFVSAPNDSREAELHDKVAAVGAKKGTTLNNSRIRSRHCIEDGEWDN